MMTRPLPPPTRRPAPHSRAPRTEADAAATNWLSVGICSIALWALALVSGQRDALDVGEVAICLPLVCLAGWWGGAGGAAVAACAAAAGWLSGGFWKAGHVVMPGDPVSFLVGGGVLAMGGLMCALIRRYQALAHRIAETDPLTGILNRNGFRHRLDAERNRCLRTGRALAVAFLDCDNFKTWNDTRGHVAGDELLKIVGSTLADNVRNYDCVARMGGDEFAILLPEVDLSGAEAALARLHDALARAMREREWPATFSMGAVVFHSPVELATMLDAADEQMYVVKHSGKNSVRVAERW